MGNGVVTGHAGNAAGDRGWFVGHFFPDRTDPRYTHDLELKWAVHEAGTSRPGWALNLTATTIVILISGHYQIHFPDQVVVLAQSGDYVLWGPAIAHSWTAVETSTLLVIRYPSGPNDSIEQP
jgi:hypothetical protein